LWGNLQSKDAIFLGGFAEGLGLGNSYFAELCGAMRSLELALSKN